MKHLLWLLIGASAMWFMATAPAVAPASRTIEIPEGYTVVLMREDGSAQPGDFFSRNKAAIRMAITEDNANLRWLAYGDTNQIATVQDLGRFAASLGTMAEMDEWQYPKVWDFANLVDDVRNLQTEIHQLFELKSQVEANRAKVTDAYQRIAVSTSCQCRTD